MKLPAPEKPLDLDAVLERWPRVRQSFLSKFDDCALSCLFEMRYRTGEWSTIEAMMGTIMHRVIAECLREMKRNDSEDLEVGTAVSILKEVLEQRGVPEEDRVRIPIREVPNLRWMVRKFAKDNRFSIRHIVDVEHRLEAPLTYRDAQGEVRTRTLSGQLDALIADPAKTEEAIILDWKTGWGLPPRHHEDDRDPGLSYHGFFQQRFYGWLVMTNYPHVKAVTLREFYTRRTQARPARIQRDELENIEKELSDLVRELDLALAHGAPKKLDFAHVGPWKPSPGKHCAYCLGARHCPIESDARQVAGAPASKAEAERMVAELEVANAIRDSHRESLRPYVDLHGPQGSKWAKGRRAFGYKTTKGGPILTFFTPQGTDRAPARAEEDAALEDAIRRSAAAAAKRNENGKKKAKPKKSRKQRRRSKIKKEEAAGEK
jgi:hypothetical protein